MLRRHISPIYLAGFCVSMGLVVSPALAASDQIGLAVIVRNNVAQVEPDAKKIYQGDDVYKDEVVQTQEESSAKFVLKDSTNLMLGPGSKLKLDQAVFSDETSVGKIAIKLAVGSFRFITGHSAKEAYVISTPIATMGVRGTVLDLLIGTTQNTVVLKEGQSTVCAAGNCVNLNKPGDTAIVKAYGSQIHVDVQPSSSWSFDSECGGMCGPMSFAEAQSAVTTGSIGGAAGAGGGGGTNGGGPTGSSSPSGSLNPLGPTGTPNGFTPALTTGSSSAGFFSTSTF